MKEKRNILAFIIIGLAGVMEAVILIMLFFSSIGRFGISDSLWNNVVFPLAGIVLCGTILLFFVNQDYFSFKKFKEIVYPTMPRYMQVTWKVFQVLSIVVFVMALFYLPITMMLSR